MSLTCSPEGSPYILATQGHTDVRITTDVAYNRDRLQSARQPGGMLAPCTHVRLHLEHTNVRSLTDRFAASFTLKLTHDKNTPI